MRISSIFIVFFVFVVVGHVEWCVCGVVPVRIMCSAWLVLGRGARRGAWCGGNDVEWMLFGLGMHRL